MNAGEKRFAKAIQKMLIFEAGLAVAETKQDKAATLHAKALKEYEARVDKFDPVSGTVLEDFSGLTYFFTCIDSHVDVLMDSIKAEKLSGKKRFGLHMDT